MKQKAVITSSSNAQVKNLNLLQKKAKARKEQGVFVVEGTKMFEEARNAGLLVKAYASESFYQSKISDNANYFLKLDYEVLADNIFKDIADTKTPQGIMGVVRQTEYSLEDILLYSKPLLLLLEDIRDPGNLGTILRSAEGAGVTGVILNRSCVDLYNPKVIRSTMGSIYRVPFYQAENFLAVLEEIKRRGITIFAAHLMGRVYDTEGSFEQSCAFLIGNEANGLSEEVSQMADIRIKIPMEGEVESLNAAVAAAILMYEAARQRRNSNNELD
ncbi:MAG: RNA methyltransferase [Clostridiales bacterium]|nr:RNA methyltransferase [Clostridiales bacterium]